MPTIQSLVNAAPAGTPAAQSVVTIPAGTYAEGVLLNRPYMTLRVAGPVFIKSPAGSAGIRIGANYVTIDGLVDGQPMLDIVATRDDGIEGNGVHHAVVRGVVAHDCGESGIQFNWSEFLTIEKNVCYRNARRGWFSGISVYQCREIGGAGPEPRTVIRDNICYDNWTPVSVPGEHTDGNGIIVDDMNSTQDASKPAWKHQTLVENNLCLRNGSKGIAVAWSDFTTVRHNTCFGNNGDASNPATWRGDLSVQSSRDCTIEGNIAVCDPSTHVASTAIGSYGGENIRNVWRSNMAWPADRALKTDGGAGANVSGLTLADPQMPGTSKPKPATGAATFVAADWLPTNPAAAGLGWRGDGVPTTPIPEPEPMPAAPAQLSPFAALKPASVLAETQAYELGTTIRADKAGRITALRLYRTNTAAQTLSLWRGGAKVASGSIPGGTGWAEVAVDVPVAAGDALIVSVGKTSAQTYAADSSALAAAVAGDGFTIPAQGGLYSTTRGALPTQVYEASYYWVDVRFAADAAVPTEPDPAPDLSAITAALAALTARVDAMAALPPAQVEYGPRILLLEEKVDTLDAATADLNRRLADLSEAASTEAIANVAAGVTAVAGEIAALKDALRAV